MGSYILLRASALILTILLFDSVDVLCIKLELHFAVFAHFFPDGDQLVAVFELEAFFWLIPEPLLGFLDVLGCENHVEISRPRERLERGVEAVLRLTQLGVASVESS